MTEEARIIRPQPGPQERFLSTPADVALYGGQAGGGKSFGLLIDPLRYISVPGFGATIFRRETTQITEEGSLWDTSMTIYPAAGGEPLKSPKLYWKFRYGEGPDDVNKVNFRHLQYDKTVEAYQGAQIPMIGFDEATHFSEYQITYMISRNRSVCGVQPYVRMTCNPDANHFLRGWVDFYVDDDGIPIPLRSGVLRWFIRLNDVTIWADDPETLHRKYGTKKQPVYPKSFTFIPASIHDNKILMEKDPQYLANLNALDPVSKARLLGGNWNITATPGIYFKREFVEIVDAPPARKRTIRAWDLAATEGAGDWTVGLKMSKCLDTGYFYVEDVIRFRESPGKVEQIIKNTASQDGMQCRIRIPQDPGQAGKAQVKNLKLLLAGWNVTSEKPTGSKEVRAKPASAQWEAGNIKVVRGNWNQTLLNELEAFPCPTDSAHDDQVDALADAFTELAKKEPGIRIVGL